MTIRTEKYMLTLTVNFQFSHQMLRGNYRRSFYHLLISDS